MGTAARRVARGAEAGSRDEGETGDIWQSVAVNADLELACRGLKCSPPVIRLATDIGDLRLDRTVTVAAHGLPRFRRAG